MGEVVKKFKLMKLKGRYFNFQGEVINYAENENDLWTSNFSLVLTICP